MAIKYLNITVTNKKARYLTRQGDIVCGNSDYRVRFAFDSEWDGHDAKVARFIWGGHFTDVEFSGTEVDVPVISGATEVKVGVYIAGDGPHTTTSAVIPCTPSILCEGGAASLENDLRYLNEAREILRQCQTVEAEAANAIKGSATGASIALNDVSPFNHTVRVSVGSKNIIPYPYADNSKTSEKGLTISNENGVLTINGTAIADGAYTFIRNGNIPVDGVYTFSGITDGGNSFYLQPYVDGSSKETVFNKPVTYEWHGHITQISLFYKAGAVFNNVVIAPQIERGTEATDYAPYVGDLSSVMLTVQDSKGDSQFYTPTDGEVLIPSNSPTMTLSTEDDRVALSVIYNKDTQTLETLMQELLQQMADKLSLPSQRYSYMKVPVYRTDGSIYWNDATETALAWAYVYRNGNGCASFGNPTQPQHAATLASIALYRHDLVFKGGLDYDSTTGVVRCTTYNSESTPGDYSNNYAVDSSAHAASGIITTDGTTYTVIGVAAGASGNPYDIYYAKPDGTVGIFHFWDGSGNVTDTVTKIK